jgi:hypothetical protein
MVVSLIAPRHRVMRRTPWRSRTAGIITLRLRHIPSSAIPCCCHSPQHGRHGHLSAVCPSAFIGCGVGRAEQRREASARDAEFTRPPASQVASLQACSLKLPDARQPELRRLYPRKLSLQCVSGMRFLTSDAERGMICVRADSAAVAICAAPTRRRIQTAVWPGNVGDRPRASPPTPFSRIRPWTRREPSMQRPPAVVCPDLSGIGQQRYIRRTGAGGSYRISTRRARAVRRARSGCAAQRTWSFVRDDSRRSLST